jgi:hypothetical protein
VQVKFRPVWLGELPERFRAALPCCRDERSDRLAVGGCYNRTHAGFLRDGAFYSHVSTASKQTLPGILQGFSQYATSHRYIIASGTIPLFLD